MANEKWIEGYSVHKGKVVNWDISCPYCLGTVKTKSREERDRFMEEFEFCPLCGEKVGGDRDG